MQIRLFGLASVVLLAGPAAAQIDVSLPASADGAVQSSGVLGFTTFDSDTSISTSRSGGNNVRHGVYEFSLASIPSDAVITSATLHLTTQGLLSNTGPTADVFFYAYGGDGVIMNDDHGLNTPGPLVADETYATGGGGVPSGTTLDIGFDDLASLQSAVSGGAGFLTVRSETVNFVTFRVTSLEGAAGGPPIFPTLDITYIPAPASAAALAMGGLVTTRRRR